MEFSGLRLASTQTTLYQVTQMLSPCRLAALSRTRQEKRRNGSFFVPPFYGLNSRISGLCSVVTMRVINLLPFTATVDTVHHAALA